MHSLAVRRTESITIAGSLPVQYLDCISGIDGGSLKLMRMLRLFKLFRLRRLQTLINMVQKAFPGSAYVVAFVELFSKFFLVAHITGQWYAQGVCSLPLLPRVLKRL